MLCWIPCWLLAAFIPYLSSGSLCSLDGLAQGQWELQPANTSKKAFLCCPLGPDLLLARCKDHRFSIDRIDGDPTVHEAATDVECQCDARSNAWLTANPAERYAWRPSGCEMMPWSASRFCELLGARRVLFVGDSTMRQNAVTLLNTLSADLLPAVASCAAQLTYIKTYKFRDDQLNETRHTLLALRPHLLVIGIGPHYHDGLQVLQQDLHLLMGTLQSVLQAWREANITHRLNVAVRSNNYPHVNCSEHLSPVAAAQHIPHHTAYSWHAFSAADKLMKAYADQHRLVFLDMYPLRLRPDGHPGHFGDRTDCLHYCLPGPLGIFNNYMMHLLHEYQ